VRAYLEELLADVLDGSIDPGRVFDLRLPLQETPRAYDAMDTRKSIKTLLEP
jgi:threonine dehydrogenase-like Zn-dependent dehydrogenase